MYEPHMAFITPENPDVSLWRYMDLAKLLSLLDREALFFARADKLGDPFEGSTTHAAAAAEEAVLRSTGMSDESLATLRRGLSASFQAFPKWTYINCWHMNDGESAAMWSQYLRTGEGVAVQSTFRRLTESIGQDEPVYVGMVQYVDYQEDEIPPGNVFYRYTHKRRSFEHEHEVRAVLQAPVLKEEGGLDLEAEPYEVGRYVTVALRMLVERIRVAPSSPTWFLETVRSAVHRFGFDIDVGRSDMDADPVF